MFGGKKVSLPQHHIDSLIGTGTHVDGDIRFSGGLRVDGHVSGNISATDGRPSTLVLSDQAVVKGDISVSHAVINGTVTGSLRGSEYVELQAGARMSGDVHYKAIEIQLGAVVDGMLHHQDDVQREQKVVALVAGGHGD